MQFALSPLVWARLGVAITLVYLVGVVVLIATDRRRTRARKSSVAEVVLCTAILTLAAYLRFWHVTTMNGGFLSMDEAAVTRTTVSSIVHFEPVDTGATYLTHAWLLDTWYRFFGISTSSPRYYTATVALLGLVFFFAALRLVLGTGAAAWATALAAVSTYAIYFSVFALETAGLMLFAPLNFLLLVLWLRKPTLARSAAFGPSFGLSFFTYPGILLGYAAVLTGWALCWLAECIRKRSVRGTGWPFRAISPGGWLTFGAAFGAVFLTGVTLHNRVYVQYRGFLQGGGGLTASYAAFTAAMPVLLRDVFVETSTWNLLLRWTPFVDWTYWPFALLGAWWIWTRYPRWVARGAILSAIIVVLLVPFAGSYPSMRRGLFVLFPICACAGAGVDVLFARAGGMMGSLLVLIAVAHPIYYQMTIGRRIWTSVPFGQDFGAAPIPDAILLDTLEKYNVVMSGDEYQHQWDRLRHIHLWKLAVRHKALQHRDHTLTFVSEKDPPMIKALADQPDTVLLTWKPETVVTQLVQAGLCFRLADLGVQTLPAIVHLAGPHTATKEDLCMLSGGEGRDITGCVQLGFRHRLSRFVHGLDCTNAGCDASRTDFVFVQPGSVSFRLKRPQPAVEPVRLVLKVQPVQTDSRQNRAFVNDHDIGLVRGAADPTGRVSVEIPSEARLDRDVWSVRIGPGDDPGKIGFDVLWAALAAGPPPAGDQCPARLCVDSDGHEICEDGS